MEMRNFGHTGMQVSVFGFGCGAVDGEFLHDDGGLYGAGFCE